MKLLLILGFILIIITVVVYTIDPEDFKRGFNDARSKEKATPTIQYTAPIGPTQEPPYHLESAVIPEKELTMSG